MPSLPAVPRACPHIHVRTATAQPEVNTPRQGPASYSLDTISNPRPFHPKWPAFQQRAGTISRRAFKPSHWRGWPLVTEAVASRTFQPSPEDQTLRAPQGLLPSDKHRSCCWAAWRRCAGPQSHPWLCQPATPPPPLVGHPPILS